MHKYGCYIYKVFQIWKFYYTFWLVALLKWCKVFVPDWRTDKQFFNKFCLNDINILIFFIFSRCMSYCICRCLKKGKYIPILIQVRISIFVPDWRNNYFCLHFIIKLPVKVTNIFPKKSVPKRLYKKLSLVSE